MGAEAAHQYLLDSLQHKRKGFNDFSYNVMIMWW
jgi:hypothetical protein